MSPFFSKVIDVKFSYKQMRAYNMKYTQSPFCAILKCRCTYRLAGLYFGSLDLLYGKHNSYSSVWCNIISL